jgi:dTDP-4-amino-4,6-dideoxygalactose transaminase
VSAGVGTMKMQVPLLDLRSQYAAIRDEIDAAIREVCASQQFILGPVVERFERKMADYCGCRFAIGVSSGTDALLCALMALGVGAGDEVIVPALTFFATAGEVARVGARPVFVDIDPRTFNIDVARMTAAITPRTRAIIPVDLYGQMAEMQSIMEVARRHNLPVIEDAAQAIGAEHHGRRAGQYATLTCFSFFPTKNLGGFGDGGLIVTDDESLARRCRMMRVHGGEEEYVHRWVGGNFRLDALQAAVLEVKLRYLDGWTERRRQNAARLDARLAGAVTTPVVLPHNRCIYHQYTIRVPGGRRDVLAACLREAGVSSRVYYPVPLHMQECFADAGVRRSLSPAPQGLGRPGDCPEAERAAEEVLSLPIYPELTDAMLDYVAETIRTWRTSQTS